VGNVNLPDLPMLSKRLYASRSTYECRAEELDELTYKGMVHSRIRNADFFSRLFANPDPTPSPVYSTAEILCELNDYERKYNSK